ncbi:zf-TFIIB domain-containing protein [Candidatus Nitrosocosmicus sp. T]
MSLRCSNCTSEMKLRNKNEIKIDSCLRCRGVSPR